MQCNLEFKMKQKINRDAKITKKQQKSFHEHVAKGQMDKVKKELEKGMDPNFFHDQSGTCRLSSFRVSGFTNPNVPVLSTSARPFFFNLSTDTPLVTAALNDDVEMIRMLVEGGAFLDFRGPDGKTPLHRAAMAETMNAINVRAPKSRSSDLCKSASAECYGMRVCRPRAEMAYFFFFFSPLFIVSSGSPQAWRVGLCSR
jgi:ankyrin repeat protein